MAVAQISTNNVIGTREDLDDYIDNISPVDTVFLKMCKKGTAKNTMPEWQTEALSAASASNAAIEGADAPTPSMELTVRQRNYTQILTKTAKVTGTADITTKAGRAREMVHQLMNKGKELKRDLESSLTQNTVGAVSVAGTTAGKLKGLECWIGDNQSLASVGSPVAPNPEGGTSAIGVAPTDGTAEAFTEARLKTVLQSCFNSGGNPDTIMAGPGNRAVFSTFDGVSSAQNLDVSSGKITGTMKIYESDWGDLKVVANRFQRNKTVFVLDSSDFELLVLRPTKTIDIAVTGDAETKQILTEVSLKVGNWHKHGSCRDNT